MHTKYGFIKIAQSSFWILLGYFLVKIVPNFLKELNNKPK